MKTIAVKNLSGLPEAAKQILSFAGTKKIFCFYGDLGAGKTTLIKEICKQLGVVDQGSSPTFSLINEYHVDGNRVMGAEAGFGTGSIPASTPKTQLPMQTIYHFDLYRLKNEAEIYDIGYEEYLFSGSYCFIEWPEKMEKLLPKDVVRVRLDVISSERRIRVE